MLSSILRLQHKEISLSYATNTRRLFFTTHAKKHGRRFKAPHDSVPPNKLRQPSPVNDGKAHTSPTHDASILINASKSRSSQSYENVSYARPLIFGGTFCLSAFIAAGVVYDRNEQSAWQRWMTHLRQQGRSEPYYSSYFSWQSWSSWVNGGADPSAGLGTSITMGDFWQAKQALMEEKRQEWKHRIDTVLQRWQQTYGLPEGLRRLGWMVTEKYASMTEADRTLAGLIGINILVFGAWQVPRWSSFMTRWFMHHPGTSGGRRPVTLITSCFSHQEGLHLACNMVGLWSFGSLMHEYLGREQFLALYLSMGVGANMASHTMSLALRRLRPLLPSLGASGAIYGLLSGIAYMKPEASISLIFLPFYPIKLGYALPALMGFDVAGMLLRWKMFDHYAHLAGASIGLGYMAYGQQHLWQPLVKNIHDIRSKQNFP